MTPSRAYIVIHERVELANIGMVMREKEMDDSGLDLQAIEMRCRQASPGPWVSYGEGRDHSSGSNFIMIGTGEERREDMELTGASIEDQDFIAHARQDIPVLIEEIIRLQNLIDKPKS